MPRRSILTAIIIYWHTDQLGRAIRERKRAGLEIQETLFRHISPLGWEHILQTCEYRWPRVLNPNVWSVISSSTGIDPCLLASTDRASEDAAIDGGKRARELRPNAICRRLRPTVSRQNRTRAAIRTGHLWGRQGDGRVSSCRERFGAALRPGC